MSLEAMKGFLMAPVVQSDQNLVSAREASLAVGSKLNSETVSLRRQVVVAWLACAGAGAVVRRRRRVRRRVKRYVCL